MIHLTRLTDSAKKALPTATHSWGTRLGPCHCGCRPQGFSLERLAKKGLYGILIPLGTQVKSGDDWFHGMLFTDAMSVSELVTLRVSLAKTNLELRVKSELNSGFRSKDANSSKLFWVRHPDILRRGIAHAERMKIRLIWNLEYISNGTAGPLPLDSQTH